MDKWKLIVNTAGDSAASKLELNGKMILARKASVEVSSDNVLPVLKIEIPIMENNVEVVSQSKRMTEDVEIVEAVGKK